MSASYHTVMPDDSRFMQAALRYARGGLGSTWPNPVVACLLVKDGVIVARGRTQPGGRPHAETVALDAAGEAARGATAYVTLEPCAHTGQTPPCTEALISAGVARVVAACTDNDPRVNGKGLAQLRAAGIVVVSGVCAAEAQALSEGFFHHLKTGRPFVTVKVASSLDGKIALAGGESKWITGAPARAYVQQLRAEHDAVLTTAATALKDAARLTLRLPHAPRPPVRVLLDRHGRVPQDAPIFSMDQPTWVYTNAGTPLDNTSAGLDLAWVLRDLGTRGITRLLVEAGGTLVTGLLRAQLVNRLEVLVSGKAIGDDGLSWLKPLGLAALPAAPVLEYTQRLGDDALLRYAL